MAEVRQASPAWDQPPQNQQKRKALARHRSPSHPPALFLARGQTQSISGLSAVLGWCSVMSIITETVRRTVFVMVSMEMFQKPGEQKKSWVSFVSFFMAAYAIRGGFRQKYFEICGSEGQRA